ncbi:MAG: hypothetical protein AAF153_03185, partial [Pseudomonadota bacterium]
EPDQSSFCAVGSLLEGGNGETLVNQIDVPGITYGFDDDGNPITFKRFADTLDLRVENHVLGVLDDSYDASQNTMPGYSFSFEGGRAGQLRFGKPAFTNTKRGGQLAFIRKNHCASIDGRGFNNTNFGRMQYAVVEPEFLEKYGQSKQLLGEVQGNDRQAGEPDITWYTIDSVTTGGNSINQVEGSDYTVSSDGILLLRMIKPTNNGNAAPSVINNPEQYRGEYKITLKGTFRHHSSYSTDIGNDNASGKVNLSPITWLFNEVKTTTQESAQTIYRNLVVNTNFVSFVQLCLLFFIIYSSYTFVMGIEQINAKEFVMKLLKIAFIAALIDPDSFWFFEVVMFDSVHNALGFMVAALNGYDITDGNHEIMLPVAQAWQGFVSWDTWARMLSLVFMPPGLKFLGGVILVA